MSFPGGGTVEEGTVVQGFHPDVAKAYGIIVVLKNQRASHLLLLNLPNSFEIGRRIVAIGIVLRLLLANVHAIVNLLSIQPGSDHSLGDQLVARIPSWCTEANVYHLPLRGPARRIDSGFEKPVEAAHVGRLGLLLAERI